MALISNIVHGILFKLGLIAILGGSAVILGEAYAGMAFTPATGRIVDIVVNCELVDATSRSTKYIADGDCRAMAAMNTGSVQWPIRNQTVPRGEREVQR